MSYIVIFEPSTLLTMNRAHKVKLIDDYHLHSNMIFFKSDNATILASIT